MGLSYDDVQEIKQITFSNAYFALKHYSEETIHPIRSSLQALLREITKNAALNLLNQKKRNVSLEQASEVYSQDDDMLDGAVSAEYFGYIDLLPEKYRVLLKVLVVYDVSYAELAQISGLKVSVVKARISQARKLLRQIMREKQIKQEGE